MTDLGFVHRFIPASAGSTRTLLLLHGTGGDESELIPLGRKLDPDAALLSPRGKILENGMPRFFRRVAEGIFDEEDVIDRANQLADFVFVAAENYSFDRAAVRALGYSNGANIAAAMMFLRPEVLDSAVLLRAMVPLSKPPATVLTGKRVLISAGATDPIIPAENAQRLAAMLRERGADVELLVQPASHALVPQDISAARRWFGA